MEKFFMNAAKMEQLVLELKDEIYTKLHHRTLLEYTGQPPVWEDQLFYLLLPKFNGEQWTEQHQVAAQSVSMIQTALSTHDLVEEHEAISKSQQLMVLAGDYYSGMYYASLAAIPNVKLVRDLSDAVAEISENKTSFYEPNKKDFVQWISQFEAIVTKAIEQFMNHFQFTSYIDIMKKGMLVSRLATELKKLQNGTSTIRFLRVLSENFSTDEQTIDALQLELRSRTVVLIEELRNETFLTEAVKEVLLGRIEAQLHAQQMTREG
ncbi:MAG: heptaprenyl diphosphate synthase component 1 [Kurthia sp.]|nr:heptaprenyl diphosphate synthase component 1 [Candidatus Kurthia equi]